MDLSKDIHNISNEKIINVIISCLFHYTNDINYFAVFRALLIVSFTTHQLLPSKLEQNIHIMKLFILTKKTFDNNPNKFIYTQSYSLMGKVTRFCGPLGKHLIFNNRYIETSKISAITITSSNDQVELYVVKLLKHLHIDYDNLKNRSFMTNLYVLGYFNFYITPSVSNPGKNTMVIHELEPLHCYITTSNENQLVDDFKKYSNIIHLCHKYDIIHDIITEIN